MDVQIVDIIINNYNYGRYLKECINSVLNQTAIDKIRQIIIVDDGSTDNSKEIFASFINPKLIYIEKQNGGQLSTFNIAVDYISCEYIFFLDSDDYYQPNYIEDALKYYETNDHCDFLYSHMYMFGKVNKEAELARYPVYYFSMMITYYTKHWISSMTSGISMRKNIFQKILPLHELESDWITRADEILGYGASLVGASKHFLGEPGRYYINYRTHDSNHWYGINFDNIYELKITLSRNRLFNTILRKNNLPIDDKLILPEFLLKQSPDKYLTIHYCLMIYNSKQLFWYYKIRAIFKILASYFLRHK